MLDYVDLPTPEPGAKEVRVRIEWAGVGVPDVMIRAGTYPWMPPLPSILGIEATGIIDKVGPDVSSLRLGDRVFVSARELLYRGGCYAEVICAPAGALYSLSPAVDLAEAACLSNYQVAWHLLHSATRGFNFESVLVWAAAGGIGSAVVQIAKSLGKRVIGVAGGADKCAQAVHGGAECCIDYTTEDVLDRILNLTNRRGVDVLLDPLGGPNFSRCFDFIGPLGLVVNYGLLQGSPHPSFSTAMHQRMGRSPALRFFSMHVFDSEPERRREATNAVLALLLEKKIAPRIAAKMDLGQAKAAHELLESKRASGKILLHP